MLGDFFSALVTAPIRIVNAPLRVIDKTADRLTGSNSSDGISSLGEDVASGVEETVREIFGDSNSTDD